MWDVRKAAPARTQMFSASNSSTQASTVVAGHNLFATAAACSTHLPSALLTALSTGLWLTKTPDQSRRQFLPDAATLADHTHSLEQQQQVIQEQQQQQEQIDEGQIEEGQQERLSGQAGPISGGELGAKLGRDRAATDAQRQQQARTLRYGGSSDLGPLRTCTHGLAESPVTQLELDPTDSGRVAFSLACGVAGAPNWPCPYAPKVVTFGTHQW